MVFGEPTAISRLHLLMTFENYDDQQADVQKCSILPKSQNCTNWLFRVHFSKVVKFVQFDAAISGGISAYWPSLTIYIRSIWIELMCYIYGANNQKNPHKTKANLEGKRYLIFPSASSAGKCNCRLFATAHRWLRYMPSR